MKHTLARIALFVLAADLALKLLPPAKDGVLVPSLLGYHLLRNRGVSFGLLGQAPLLALIVSAAIVLFGTLWLRQMSLSRPEEFACGLMMGGALGNLIDRALHGAVTDYLEFLFVRFPVFNLADACLVTGAVLLAFMLLMPGKQAAA